jgi:mRNA interferase HigB
MHVITQRRLKEFWEEHPTAEPPLRSWYSITSKATWKTFADVRRSFNSADIAGIYVVFNIGGNNYRLITKVEYQFGKVFIAHVFTHAEYDRWNASQG